MPDFSEIKFKQLLPEQQDILIAELSAAGFSGFEEDNDCLIAYIESENLDRKLLAGIISRYQLIFEERTIPEQNWNREWEKHFEPVVIGDFVGIRADFHEPMPSVAHELVITPKMSFGTGHHATTSLMIRAMKDTDFTGQSVVDFGTGTGILAILAERLGAAKITAIDNDDWSIENARENITRNNCNSIELVKAGNVQSGEKANILLANINKNVILDNMDSFSRILQPGGLLLVSGLLVTDEQDIMSSARTFSFQFCKRTEENNWICLLFKH